MAFLDVASELLKIVDFEKSKIIQPQKLVFFCGGMGSGNASAPTSLREVLLAKSAEAGTSGYLGDAKVILAEKAVNYLADSSFDNLLDLERCIAAVVHAVVLIVESPGSICELGAFVMAPEICNKLLVVMQSKYLLRSSFITSGAIKYATKHHNLAEPLGYICNEDPMTQIINVDDYIIDEMLKELPTAMDAVHTAYAKQSFDANLDGHKIFLTLSFCHLVRAAKQSDIRRCFEFSGIKITDTQLRNFIDVLVICELIKSMKVGKLNYYVALVEQMPLEIAFKDGIEKSDRSTARWIARIIEEIKKDNDEINRIGIFKSARHE